MIIYVMHDLSGAADIVENFESVIWNMQFYGVGDFELIIPYDKNHDICSIGSYLVRDIDVGSGEYHNVMRIESRQLSYDADKGWILTLSGSGLKKIVGQRVAWSQTNFENENVESAIRQLITDNIISPEDTDRTIDNFILDDPVGFTDTFDAQVFSENLAEWIESTCQQYSYGWDVYIKYGKFVFTLIQGTERTYESGVDPVIFSPEFENLVAASYEYSLSEYHNAALVGGEGEGIDQVNVYVGSSSGLERYETYVDAGSVSSNGEIITMETYRSMLQSYGEQQLTQMSGEVKRFEGEIMQGLYTLNKDFFLGDVVEVDIIGLRAKSRIIEVIYSEDENGSSLLPTFADWEV